MSLHKTRGPIVAQVRYWLQCHDRAASADPQSNDEIIAPADDDGRPNLTVTQLRTLLAEHDAYRNEARAAESDDGSGWTAAENAEWNARYSVEAVQQLRAAKNRAWAIVQELRKAAVAEGRDPYQDPMAQWLAGALVGVDAKGFCELPHMSTEEDECDRRHYARGGVVSAGATAGFGSFGCVVPMPSRADVEADTDGPFRNHLRGQLVTAGTAAAEQWLATRASRRMADVNRKRLAGHVVNALWEQIEQAAIQLAQHIAAATEHETDTGAPERLASEQRELLQQTASNIREFAHDAAHDIDGDTTCCWDLERIGGVERVIAIRQYPDGTDHEIVVVPLYNGIAQHVAAWHPRTAEAAAALIDDIAAGNDPTQAALRVARTFMNLEHIT